VEDGGLGGQGDEERVAIEDEHEGVRQEEQPDEGVGTGEAVATAARGRRGRRGWRRGV
jgi:hypothetical protein